METKFSRITDVRSVMKETEAMQIKGPEKEALTARLLTGWRTWCNESVLTHVHMPEGLGIALGIKDYEYGALIKDALVGEEGDRATVFPRAHTYDSSYTCLDLTWKKNSLTVESAEVDGDYYILVTPHSHKVKESSLMIYGVCLWNRDARLEKKEGRLFLTQIGKDPAFSAEISTTGTQVTEYFAEAAGPYLAVSLDREIGITTGKNKTLQQIKAAIGKGKSVWKLRKEAYGDLSEVYNAMQTCQAWDTIYNPENNSVITTVSRNWNKRWGGYVMFCWDTFFGVIMQSAGDPDLACSNLLEILNDRSPEGFVPNFCCQGYFRSYDRSQPPVGSAAVLELYRKTGDIRIPELTINALLEWNSWFYENRRTGNGCMAFGSGNGKIITSHYLEWDDVHNRQAAAYESGLDDSPMYDDTPYDEESGLFLLDDVGLTGLFLHDCYTIAELCGLLKREADKELVLKRAECLEAALEGLWSEEAGMYLNRRTDTGLFDHRLTPFHFLALFGHSVGQKRAERIIKEHFYNPDEFFGEWMLPSIARNDPAYPDQIYWRGRIWPPMNYLAYLALKEYDLPNARKTLADSSEKLILKEWLAHGHVHENYSSETGDGCGVHRSDKFYHWGGLLAVIALMEKGQW